MSSIHPEFTDSESASFLHEESKISTSQERFESPARNHVTRWNHLSAPIMIPRFLVYMIALFMAVILLTLMGILVSLSGIREKRSMLPAQSMFGEGT